MLLLLLLLEQNVQVRFGSNTHAWFGKTPSYLQKHGGQNALVELQMHNSYVEMSLYLHFVGHILAHARHCLGTAERGIG